MVVGGFRFLCAVSVGLTIEVWSRGTAKEVEGQCLLSSRDHVKSTTFAVGAALEAGSLGLERMFELALSGGERGGDMVVCLLFV